MTSPETMPLITDWLMVIITAIYVIATIAICWANVGAAKATREQLVESRRQYEDKKRLEIMPYIQFEKSNEAFNYKLNLVLNSGGELTGHYILNARMKNIGNGTAKGITYIYQWDNYKHSYDKGAFPVQALSSGESQTIQIDFSYTPNKVDTEVCFLLHYEDLLENAYSQELKVKFTYTQILTLKPIKLSTSSPCLEIKETTHA